MKYLISGLPPSTSSGIGRLMLALKPIYESKGYKLIYPVFSPSSLRPLVRRRLVLEIFKELFLRLRGRFLFISRCLVLSNSKVTVIHPQSIGFALFFFLLWRNKLSIYLMDNSFFCIVSYNCHPVTHSECLECLGVLNPHPLCNPFPKPIFKPLSIAYLNYFQKVSSSVSFLCQNTLQQSLVKAHFGESSSCSLVGMDPFDNTKPTVLLDSPSVRYDIVFHGASHMAKGIFFIVEIAKFLGEYTFLIPDSLENVSLHLGYRPTADNLFFRPMSWETGLRDAVIHSRITMNPSMWSAPIEGALLKSLTHAPIVATVETQYGFERELADNPKILRLPSDPLAASLIITRALKA